MKLCGMEMFKMLEETGHSEAEKFRNRRKHTRYLTQLQVMEVVERNSASNFTIKVRNVTLSKKEAEFYLANFCGGTVMLPNETQQLQSN